VRFIAELRSPFERFKLLSALYLYNSNMLAILEGNM